MRLLEPIPYLIITFFLLYACGPTHDKKPNNKESEPCTFSNPVAEGADPWIKWAIDVTPLEYKGQLYAVWSGWEENEDTDRTPQHLYIAEMKNPWTISSDRVQLSSPDNDWEKSTELAINEGPEVLKKNGETFIIYSASESWLPAYKLGQLQLVGEDPMNPDNWEKSGPVFQGTGEVHGVGHASFTTSPDETEDWIAYHTKVNTEPGWERVIHLQPFEWDEDGSPDFGTPIPSGKTLIKPFGQCD